MAYCALNVPYWAITAAFYVVSTVYYCSITVPSFCITESSATTIFMPSLLPIVLWLCPMCHHSLWLYHHCAIWRHHNDPLCHYNIILFLPKWSVTITVFQWVITVAYCALQPTYCATLCSTVPSLWYLLLTLCCVMTPPCHILSYHNALSYIHSTLFWHSCPLLCITVS